MVERQALHGTRLIESVGVRGNEATGLVAPSQLVELPTRIAEQSSVISYADAYLALIPIALFLLLLVAFLPRRAYPPQPPSH